MKSSAMELQQTFIPFRMTIDVESSEEAGCLYAILNHPAVMDDMTEIFGEPTVNALRRVRELVKRNTAVMRELRYESVETQLFSEK